MKKTRTALVWILLVAVLAALLILRNDGERREFLPFSAFAGDVEAGEVAAVHVDGPAIAVTATDGRRYLTHGALDAEMREKLRRQGAALGYGRMDEGSSLSWLAFVVPIALLVFFLLYFLRKSRGNFGDVLSMRRSPHREVSGSESRHTFADVGGCEEAKELLADVIDFLNHPQRWMQAGARLPRGVLLEGPPGCGKTLLARAVAGETKAKFFLVSGSEFVEMFVGVGAARVRDLFETAIKQAPAVVFIDEIDALGRRRGSGIGGSHDEREQTLNQLLVCLDGFRPNDRIVVLAATNRPDVLDQALVRPGRIDRRIRIPELSEESRLEVLKIHTRGKPLDASVDLADLARRTAGLHGAQLENLTNEAALAAVRRARREASDAARITGGDFARALEAMEGQDRRFNKVDAVIIESGSQLAEPTGAARVRLTLKEAPPVEGEVVWADAAFFKIRRTDGGPDLLVAKRQVLHLEVLDGTDAAPRDGIQVDAWAARRSDSA